MTDVLKHLANLNELDERFGKGRLESVMVARHILLDAQAEIERLRIVEAEVAAMHRALYPERYYTDDEMDNEGFRTEWSADTAPMMAQFVENAAVAGKIEEVQLEESYRPPTQEQEVRAKLEAMEPGERKPFPYVEVIRSGGGHSWLIVGEDDYLGLEETTDIILLGENYT